jgi:hypothetical protein
MDDSDETYSEDGTESDSSGAEFCIQRALSGQDWRRITDSLRLGPSVRSVKLRETDLVDDERLERLLASMGKASSFSMHLGSQAALLLSTLTRALSRLKFTRLALHGDWEFSEDLVLLQLAAALPSSSLTHLKLQSHAFTDANQMKALVDGLRSSKITSLSFNRSRMGTNVIKILAQSLPDMKLNELDLSATGINDEGVMAVASVLRDTSIEKLSVRSSRIGPAGIAAITEGVRDTAVTTVKYCFEHRRPDRLGSSAPQALTEALTENQRRSFLLQMQVEGEPSDWTMTFRAMSGTVAGVLKWSSERPTRELPAQVFDSMKIGGFQLPSRHLRAENLRFILPNGKSLDCKGDLAEQLGLKSPLPRWSASTKPRTKGSRGAKRARAVACEP